ncbi:MAG: hypothetical protein MI741_05500, partial [Rhodospirillales bacterium]|nr:hypothetical protein [Rhodospirillales bacterium]
MPAVIPWDYEEISRSENMDRSSFDAQRVLKCAWENRLKLAQALLGGTVDTVAYSRGTYDDWPAAVVTKVGSIQPFQANPQDKNGDGLAATFDHAQLTVQYSTIFSPNGEQQVSNADGTRSEGLRGAKEFLTLPAKQLYWANNQTQPLPDEHQPGLLVSMIEWSVTLARQTSIHTDHLTASGKINNA